VAKAADDVQSGRKRYWEAYKESEREYPAEIFPEGVDGYGEFAQSTGKSNCYVRSSLGAREHEHSRPRIAPCACKAASLSPLAPLVMAPTSFRFAFAFVGPQ